MYAYHIQLSLVIATTDYSIREYLIDFHGIKLRSLKYPPNMPALCWHSTPAYYAFYYAGIFHVVLIGF